MQSNILAADPEL